MIINFILFSLCSLIGLGGGVLAQRYLSIEKGAALSRHLHLLTLAGLWAPLIGISIWRDLPINQSTFLLLLIEPLHLIVVTGLGLLFARKVLKWDWGRSGVLAMASSLGNKGVTLGAVMCWFFLPSKGLQESFAAQGQELPVSASEQAMSVGLASVTVMSILSVVLLFPLAAWCRSHSSDERIALGHLLKQSFFTLRAGILWCALVGLLLNIGRVPSPGWLGHPAISMALILTSSITAYSGIGLRLKLRAEGAKIGAMPHIWCLLAQVALCPLLTAGVLYGAKILERPCDLWIAEAYLLVAMVPAAIQSVAIPNLFHLDSCLAAKLWAVNTAIWCVVVLPTIVLFCI